MLYLVFDKLILREDPGMLTLNTSSSQAKKKRKEKEKEIKTKKKKFVHCVVLNLLAKI